MQQKRHIQILKASLPYMHSPLREACRICVRMFELQQAMHVANFSINEQDYNVLLRYFSFGLHRLKSYRVRFEQEKNAPSASN